MLQKNLYSVTVLLLAPLFIALSMQPIADSAVFGNSQPETTILDLVEGTPQLSEFNEALEAANMKEELSDEGPYTILLPVNDAFESLPDGYMDQLLEEDSREQLQKVLNNHIIEGEKKSVDIAKEETLETKVEELEVDASGNVIKVGESNMIQTDVEASNGIIHVVDKLVLPSDM